jgi:hypothetical protein
MTNARVEAWMQNAKACPSTDAVIQHAEDDGEEEVTSKFTPIPKKTFWRVVKEFFQTRHNFGRYRYPFGPF